jgi:hypothetical protein
MILIALGWLITLLPQAHLRIGDTINGGIIAATTAARPRVSVVVPPPRLPGVGL